MSAQKVTTQLIAAIKTHAEDCSLCGGPDDGCDLGQRLEEVMLDFVRLIPGEDVPPQGTRLMRRLVYATVARRLLALPLAWAGLALGAASRACWALVDRL